MSIRAGNVKNNDPSLIDPVALSATFPNLDVGGRLAYGPGLADTVWVSVALDGADGRLYADHVTLQGPDVYRPAR